MAVDPALAAIGGTAVGGFITWAIERARWKRQQSVRWDETRLSRYTDLFVSMDRYLEYSLKIKAGLTDEDTTESSRKHLELVSTRLSEIEVISLPAVHAAAVTWLDEIYNHISSPFHDDVDKQLARMGKIRHCRQLFINEAKKELSVAK